VILVEPGAIRSEFRATLSKVWGDLPERVKGTRYEPILAAYMETRRARSEDWAGDAGACAARIAEAMGRKRPPRRVLIGRDSRWAGRLKALLPMGLWERLLKRAYGLR
jgi:hypothetical protein